MEIDRLILKIKRVIIQLFSKSYYNQISQNNNCKYILFFNNEYNFTAPKYFPYTMRTASYLT